MEFRVEYGEPAIEAPNRGKAREPRGSDYSRGATTLPEMRVLDARFSFRAFFFFFLR